MRFWSPGKNNLKSWKVLENCFWKRVRTLMLVIPTTQVSTVPFLFQRIVLMLVSQTPLVSTVPFLFNNNNNNKYILIWRIYKAQSPSLKFTESVVWVSERRLMVRVSGLKRVLKKAYIPVGLSWPVVVRCHCGLVVHGWFKAIAV